MINYTRTACCFAFILLLAGTSCSYRNKTANIAVHNDTMIIKAGAVPVPVSRQFRFTEGPAANKNGDVFFTDQPNNTIWKYSTTGTLSLFMENAGRANGLAFDREGNLLACADEQNQIWSITPGGTVTVLLKGHKEQFLNGPNDLWVHNRGGIYFTDPLYKRPYWTGDKQRVAGEQVYYLAKGKTEAAPVITNLQKPNGITGTADGRYLYVADIGGKKTFKYTINEDGSLGEGSLFTELGSDGMTLDNRGNVYLTGDGVTVFNPQGQKIKHIAIPEKWTANVTFGGTNRDVLFITASQAVYTLQMEVKGVE